MEHDQGVKKIVMQEIDRLRVKEKIEFRLIRKKFILRRIK